jgi:hypothetical protein
MITSPAIPDELDPGDGPDDHPTWLALADLFWRAGALTPAIRARVLRIVRDRAALADWEEKARPARARVLESLGCTLRSRMPPPQLPRPRHPCDWKAGELIVWRTADGGAAVLRVVAFDRSWGGGGSPVVELVGSSGSGAVPPAAELARAVARRPLRAIPTREGRPWRGLASR